MSFINEGKLLSAIFLSWCNTTIVNKIFFGQYHYFPYLTESKTESERGYNIPKGQIQDGKQDHCLKFIPIRKSE